MNSKSIAVGFDNRIKFNREINAFLRNRQFQQASKLFNLASANLKDNEIYLELKRSVLILSFLNSFISDISPDFSITAEQVLEENVVEKLIAELDAVFRKDISVVQKVLDELEIVKAEIFDNCSSTVIEKRDLYPVVRDLLYLINSVFPRLTSRKQRPAIIAKLHAEFHGNILNKYKAESSLLRIVHRSLFYIQKFIEDMPVK